jgi:glycosyltransferase involved in cell wall biosynthesis
VKILLTSYVFSPSVGGIETVSALLAPEFVRAGHEVILVTRTKPDDGKSWPFEIHRNPSPAKFIELTRWCDVFFQNNISLQLAWPLLFVPRPWIIAHNTWIGPYGQSGNIRDHIKRSLLRYGTNVTISRPVADDIPVISTVVGNPYSDTVFRHHPEIPRDRELVYLGRLVSDKGVDLLIHSLVDLRKLGIFPRLTIIGSGSEEAALRRMATEMGVHEQIEFAGSKGPHDVARLLNAHQILVVPSLWPEPFGIVALEGLGSGCAVIAAKGGGLPEVVGPCGVLFEMGNRRALTQALHTLLTKPEARNKLLEHAEEHLDQFKAATIASRYLQVFERAIREHAAFS